MCYNAGMSTPHKGYYSLIQFCPDASRLEAVNVGIVILCPALDILSVRVADPVPRVERFFGPDGHDLSRVPMMVIATTDRLAMEPIQTVGDLARFAASRANIILTPPRPMRISDPVADLAHLFEVLVE